MNIRMYNCYFGDCFNIENKNGADLLVDFGIHRKSMDAVSVDKRFDEVCRDIVANGDKDFLLSHYHEDHYNGVIYLRKKYKYKFRDVYIPDIWNIPGCLPAIELHLIREILEGYHIVGGENIISFLQSICSGQSRIYFVNRGMKIQNSYVALWPQGKYVREKAKKVFEKTIKKMDLPMETVDSLEEFSNRLRQVVLKVYSRDYLEETIMTEINELKKDIIAFARSINADNVDKQILIPLRDFENEISIVFQNTVDCTNDNLLFVGDFGKTKTEWNFIEDNSDKKRECKMHDFYRAIKIGHHGTHSYYHSFSSKMNSNSVLMIPNGGNKNNWNISSDYSLNVCHAGARAICSDNHSCNAKTNNGSCPCVNHTIINGLSSFFEDI